MFSLHLLKNSLDILTNLIFCSYKERAISGSF
nr:MAG TPA: hypothetical protein [Caudoviricetes sp.]